MIRQMLSTCPSLSSWALMASSCSFVVHSACCSCATSSCSKSNQSSSQRWAESFDWAATEVRKTSLASSPSLFDQKVRSFWRYKNIHTNNENTFAVLCTQIQNRVFRLLPSSGHRGLQPLCCPAAAPIQTSDVSVSPAVPGTPGGKVTLYYGYQWIYMCLMFFYLFCLLFLLLLSNH